MTKRELTLTIAKVAGYHADNKTFTRAFIEGRVNMQAMQRAWNEGASARLNGAGCSCYACKTLKP